MLSKFTNPLPSRSVISSALAALIMTVSLPQIALAASDAGIWKVDAAKSRLNSSSATLTIKRVEGSNPTAPGRFIVISGTGVYLMTGAAADSTGLKPVDFTRMTQTGEAVLIGTNPRSKDACAFECRAGLPERTRTVTFTVVKRGVQQIKDMLAYDDQTW
jgi:hypothetical protein